LERFAAAHLNFRMDLRGRVERSTGQMRFVPPLRVTQLDGLLLPVHQTCKSDYRIIGQIRPKADAPGTSQ
jgi:hypothetical protein